MKKPSYNTWRAAKKKIAIMSRPLSVEILEFLRKGNSFFTVTEIMIGIRRSQSRTSQALLILKETGIIKSRQDGIFVYYSIDEENFKNYDFLISKISSL